MIFSKQYKYDNVWWYLLPNGQKNHGKHIANSKNPFSSLLNFESVIQ